MKTGSSGRAGMPIPMLLVDVVDDRVAQPPAEVDVEVGEVRAAFIEKPLEGEVVPDRVHVRDAEGIRHDRARPRSAPRDGRPQLPRVADDIRDDEEVVGEAEARYEIKLAVDPLADLARDVPIARARPRVCVLAKPRDGVAVELREDGREAQEIELARLGHARGLEDRVRHVEEEPAHVLKSPQPRVGVAGDRASCLLERRVELHRRERLVELEVGVAGEVHLGRPDRPDAEARCRIDERAFGVHVGRGPDDLGAEAVAVHVAREAAEQRRVAHQDEQPLLPRRQRLLQRKGFARVLVI